MKTKAQQKNNKNKNDKNLRWRMYGLVCYSLSPIQKGIQFGHAVVEYSNEYFNDANYNRWSTVDKTFIVLNGGTTNSDPINVGTLQEHIEALRKNGIKFEAFSEPDLNDATTAVAFLVSEKAWDVNKYPFLLNDDKNDFLRTFLSKFKLA